MRKGNCMCAKMKKAVSAFLITAALTFNVFAKQQVLHEKCTVVEPVDTQTISKRAEYIDKFYLYVYSSGIPLKSLMKKAGNYNDLISSSISKVIYFHTFKENTYAVFFPDAIELVQIGKNIYNDDNGLKSITEYSSGFCGPMNFGLPDKIKDIYVFPDNSVAAVSDKGRLWVVKSTEQGVICSSSDRIIKDHEGICYTYNENGELVYGLYKRDEANVQEDK